MAATVALAVGLSRTPTPVGDEAQPSPAGELLGFPLPGPPTAARMLFGWVPDGFALTFLVLAAGLYATGVLALRRRGDRWPVGRSIAWTLGLAVFAWATVGGLGLYSHVLFSAHMISHMLLSMVAPIGLVLGAPVTLALRALPGPRVRGEASPRGMLIAALHSPVVRLITHPLVAFALFVGSLYVLYFTDLFATLMSHHLGHVAMEFHFLAVGTLFFWVLVGIDPAPRRLPPIARIVLLFAAMPFHAFFSIALMSGTVLLAPDYYRRLHRPYWTDLLADQHLGGGIGWAMGELPILLVLGAVFVQWARSDAREASRFDRANDDELDRYNARLAQLAGTLRSCRTFPHGPGRPATAGTGRRRHRRTPRKDAPDEQPDQGQGRRAGTGRRDARRAGASRPAPPGAARRRQHRRGRGAARRARRREGSRPRLRRLRRLRLDHLGAAGCCEHGGRQGRDRRTGGDAGRGRCRQRAGRATEGRRTCADLRRQAEGAVRGCGVLPVLRSAAVAGRRRAVPVRHLVRAGADHLRQRRRVPRHLHPVVPRGHLRERLPVVHRRGDQRPHEGQRSVRQAGPADRRRPARRSRPTTSRRTSPAPPAASRSSTSAARTCPPAPASTRSCSPGCRTAR